jgi:DNA-binding response OmpR family regulator
VTGYDDGVVAMDFGTRSAALRGQRLALTPTEYRLLRAFVSEPGQVLSTEQLLEDAWGDRSTGSSARVKHAIHRLREKLVAAGGEPHLIDAVRGFGYRYTALEDLDG